MFGLQILDLLIGLIFIYILLALVCSVVNEMIAGVFDSRMRNLGRGIHNLLGETPLSTWQQLKIIGNDEAKSKLADKSHVEKFYNHPLIKTLYEDGTRPSYIPSKTFARALIDMFAPAQGNGTRTVQDFANGVKSSLKAYSDLRQNLLILVDESENNMEKLTANLEAWFNNAMDRISAWYKNKSQAVLLILALLFSVIMNADSIQIARSLYNDNALRSAMVAQAQEYAKKPAVPATPKEGEAGSVKSRTEELATNLGEIKKLGIKIGWDNESMAEWRSTWRTEWPFKLAGLLLTALAVSLGAPFWFDTLNKLVSIRAVGKSPNEKSTKQDGGDAGVVKTDG